MVRACVLFTATKHFSQNFCCSTDCTTAKEHVFVRWWYKITNVVYMQPGNPECLYNLSKLLCTVIASCTETFWSSGGILFFASARALLHMWRLLVWRRTAASWYWYKLCYPTLCVRSSSRDAVLPWFYTPYPILAFSEEKVFKDYILECACNLSPLQTFTIAGFKRGQVPGKIW